VFVAVAVGGTAVLVVVAVGGTRLVDIRIQSQRARDRVGRHGQAEAVAGDEGVFRPPQSIPPAFGAAVAIAAAGAIAAALNCVAGALVVSTVVG